MSWWNLAEELEPSLCKGDLLHCRTRVSETIESFQETPFHKVLDLKFTNAPLDVARFLDEFIKQENNRDKLKAVYTETNRFDINPDRWFFDLFGYEYYGGHEDYDWISDFYTSSDLPGVTLTGMEELQRVYASDAFYEKAFREVHEYCSLLVVISFQELIKKSVLLIENLEIPVLAASHDYDFIFEHSKNNAE